MASTPKTALAPLMTTLWPKDLVELERCAERWARTDFVPKQYQGKPDAIIACVQMGNELGLSPFTALRSIAVINGMPSMYGDGLLALCQAAPSFEDIKEEITGEGDKRTASCMVRRRGRSPVTVLFSVADAKKAQLWTKAGPWQLYPDRMLQMRARGFALRDTFADVLRGLISREEAEDMPVTIEGELARDDTPEPAPKTRREENLPKANPAAREWQQDARAQKVAKWMHANKQALDAATSDVVIDAILAANEKAAARLTDEERAVYLGHVEAAQKRVRQAQEANGADHKAEELLEMVAGFDLTAIRRLRDDRTWREAYNALDEFDQERVADAVEARRIELEREGGGDHA